MVSSMRKQLQWVLLVTLVIFSLIGVSILGNPPLSLTNTASAQTTNTVDDDGIFTQIYKRLSPSVVAINLTVTGRGGRVVGTGTGSGFVFDLDGHIVTNAHVVSGASRIEIEFYNGMLAAAEIVGLDASSDIAVLHVDVPVSQLSPVIFGDSDTLDVGETVLAIGSPYGEDWTLTSGIVSGLNRVISGLTNFAIGGVIQTDAAINPGNSGGPLLNLDGQVVGVNSQIISESGSNSGVSFAVPSNLVQRVVQELIANGSVAYSYLGFSGTDITLSLIEALNLPATTRGVIVTDISRNGPLDEAGVQAATFSGANTRIPSNYDIITAIEGIPVLNTNDLISFLARETVPGEIVTLTILRDGTQNLELPVMLATRP